MSVSDWSATADENTSIDGINIAEHCPAKNMNDALRAMMAALKNKCDTLDDTDNTLRRGAVIGEIRWFAMSTPPEGWLVCNGASVSTSDYAALFAAIGKTFTPRYLDESLKIENPQYSDPDIFLLPNLMGKVPWGTSSQVGTVMEAGLPNITGQATFINSDGVDNTQYPDRGALYWENYAHNVKMQTISGTGKRDIMIDASRSNNIYGASTTVQPPALCLLPCIRYE
nr:MAG TPA: tail collar domain [Bacteriophage sp.]